MQFAPGGKRGHLRELLKLKSDDYTLKGPAIIALLKIDPANAEKLKPLVEELFKGRDPRWTTHRLNAAQALGELGKDAKPLLTVLVDGLRRVEIYERSVFMTAIRRIDPEALKTG